MTGALADALLAARLVALAPQTFGGLALRGGGPARERVLEQLRSLLPAEAPSRRLPGHIDDERLAGGTDIAASLAAGRLIAQRGLLDETRGGTIIVPMAERLRADLSGRLTQALDHAAPGDAGLTLILLDDGIEPDERPPAALLERVGFWLDLSLVRPAELAGAEDHDSVPLPLADVALPDEPALAGLAATALALGIPSLRPLLFAVATARGCAALAGRRTPTEADVQAAARLVLAPRATCLPAPPANEEEPEQAPPPPSESPEDPPPRSEDENAAEDDTGIPEDLILAAALAAIPPDVLELIASGRAARGSRGGGGAGQRTTSRLRGRPLGARPGLPGGGVRLALIDTLRAAIPWQPLRRLEGEAPRTGPLRFRRSDLRVRRFEERTPTVTIFCVDASGSAAMARLAEAKGAVELILAQAYVKRAEVALVAFRGEGAELILPATRSLTRAKRALAALPGGGGTPLASGIALARQVGEAVAARGRTPLFVFLTDGSANIAADGTRGRGPATEDALTAARMLAAGRRDAVVIDISPRPRPEAGRLAQAMHARYIPLPFADAKALNRAVASVTAPERAGAR